MHIVWLFFILTACSVGPSYVPPCIEVPDEWKNETECCSFTYADNWWEVFEDCRLNELEALAIENNRNLYIAFERVNEAHALMGMAAADLYPQLTLNPLYTSTGELIKNYSRNVAVQPLLEAFRVHELLYFFPLNLSYEVDLWGKIQDQVQAATYNWRAEQKDYDAVMLKLTTDLAYAYYQLRTADKQIELLEEVIKTREKSFRINQDRYEGKIILYADVALAGEELGSVLMQYNEVVRIRGVLENQIAVLIGTPASLFCQESIPLEDLPPCIPAGIPSNVLLQRPDIAEAEYRVRSQHALLKQAYTQYFPSLILTGTLGYESPIFKDFMRWISRYWMYGVGANQMVFDGFYTPYNVQLMAARLAEAGGAYQQQVLVAFQEVENSLINLAQYHKQYDDALITVQWAEKAYTLYRDRYTLGVINYIDVVNTQRDLLNFQLQANGLQGSRYLATIEFIKTIGGGWGNDDCTALQDY